MNLVVFLNLIRYKNLLLICYVFCLQRFLLFPAFELNQQLTFIQFLVLLIATLLITSAGYIINDIYDVETDKINKPKKVVISKFIHSEKANRLYFFLNAAGIISGIGLTINIQQPKLAFIFIVVPLLLYYYSKILQKKAFLGNLIVSILISLSVCLLIIVEFKNTNLEVNLIVITLTIFSFFLNLSREIVKDIIDIKGDYNQNYKSLPIILGKKRSSKLATLFSFLPTIFLVFLIISIKSNYEITRVYLLFLCVIPLIYITSKLLKENSYKQLNQISLLLKIVMFLGISSLILISYNL